MAQYSSSNLLVVTLAFLICLLPALTASPTGTDIIPNGMPTAGSIKIEPLTLGAIHHLQKRAPMDSQPSGPSHWRKQKRQKKIQEEREAVIPPSDPFTDEDVNNQINRKIEHHEREAHVKNIRDHLVRHHTEKKIKWQGRQIALYRNDRAAFERLIGYYQRQAQNANLKALRRARAAKYIDYYQAKLNPPPPPPSGGNQPATPGGPGRQDPGTPDYYSGVPTTPPFDFGQYAGNWQ